jgi:hypothetical protein
MRSEILVRIQSLLEQEDLENIRAEVRSAMDEFRTLTQEEVRKQKEAWSPAEGNTSETFEYTAAPEEAQFEEIVTQFKAREKAWRKQVADDQRANMEKKTAMLERLRHTIQEEENIGSAFVVFNEVREEWSKVGEVPGDRHKEVHDQYYRLQDEFFYNINIYKELKDHDLKVNQKKKEDLLVAAKAMTALESLKDRQKDARQLQKQWLDIGPSPRENYKEMADEFFGMIRPVFEEVKEHYQQVKATFIEHAEKKTALIEQLRAVVAEEVEGSHESWQAATAKVIALQQGWKTTGFAGKDQNEVLWGQFRELADVFFAKKQLFYDDQKEATKVFKTEKLALIEKAQELASNTNWKDTAPKMMDLQKAWKETGACSPREEQKLWSKFRKIQDSFFKARKAEMAGRIEEEKKNLGEKKALIEEIKAFAFSEKRKDDLAALKTFSERWNAIGFIPRKSLDSVMNAYRSAMDVHYDALSAQKSERAMETYKQRIDHLVSDDIQNIRREQRILREKMDRIKTRVNKTEENIERFTGKGAESIRAQYEKSMEADRKEMEDIRAKLTLLRNAANKAEEEKNPKSPEGAGE